MTVALFLLLTLFSTVYAADPDLVWPLDYRVLTSGFGDLRSGHFHAGVDVSVGGKRDVPVRAAGDGHISRLRVKHGGYGRALYLDTDSGMRIVYAHLARFSPRLDSLMQQEQIRQNDYEIDLYLAPGEFSVAQNQVLGRVGGSGAGPIHLHLEVRTQQDEALDPLTVFQPSPDRYSPQIHSLLLAPADDTGRINGLPVPHRLNPNEKVTLSGFVVAYHASSDRYRSNRYRLACRDVRLYSQFQKIDVPQDTLLWEHQGWIDSQLPGDRGHFRLITQAAAFREADSLLELGRLDLHPGERRVKVSDLSGQSAVFRFQVSANAREERLQRRNLFRYWLTGTTSDLENSLVRDHWDWRWLNEDSTMVQCLPRFPQFSMMDDTLLWHLQVAADTVRVRPGNWLLQSGANAQDHWLLTLQATEQELTIGPEQIYFQEPLLLTVPLPENHWLERQNARGEWKPVTDLERLDSRTAQVKVASTGRYRIVHDQQPPAIWFPGTFNRNATITSEEPLIIFLDDTDSGIARFQLLVDSIQVFPEHDRDEKRLVWWHDPRFTAGRHELQVQVTDRVGRTVQCTRSYEFVEVHP